MVTSDVTINHRFWIIRFIRACESTLISKLEGCSFRISDESGHDMSYGLFFILFKMLPRRNLSPPHIHRGLLLNILTQLR
jgi:hypothetical protein